MTLFQAFGQFAGQAAVAPAGPGMVLIKPTSIANTSGTATLGTNGQITFSGVNVLNVNGAFSADYVNYLLVTSFTGNNNGTCLFRFRAAGSDASGNDYVYQRIESQTSVVGSRTTGNLGRITNFLNSYSAAHVYVYEPFLAEKTAFRATSIFGVTNGGGVIDHAQTHQLTTSYDGFSLLPNGGYVITGNLAIYGVKQ